MSPLLASGYCNVSIGGQTIVPLAKPIEPHASCPRHGRRGSTPPERHGWRFGGPGTMPVAQRPHKGREAMS